MSEIEELRAAVATLANVVCDLAGLVAHPGTSGGDTGVAVSLQTAARRVETELQRPAA
jgi:hypothetical protein